MRKQGSGEVVKWQVSNLPLHNIALLRNLALSQLHVAQNLGKNVFEEIYVSLKPELLSSLKVKVNNCIYYCGDHFYILRHLFKTESGVMLVIV